MTETQTVDLAAWLTRIWDEEERRENAKRTWRPDAPPMDVTTDLDRGGVYVSNPGSGIQHWLSTEDYDRTYLIPAPDKQVLARIAADRKILELHRGPHDCRVFKTGSHPAGWLSAGSTAGQWAYVSTERFVDQPCPTKLVLASPYKGREGWQEAWGHE